ncbi:hypothetical protein BVH74_12560 [Halopseudomonas phragmitis]|uniref:Uncharacterized protein n=2 Tax=Halopseudomonas phragmitis TaxID=1931241 RepID=A0A1V0B6K8_9GAMM|nr:hypothetical protein BVH74_12560 [Halopseudomonas phragmitis]
MGAQKMPSPQDNPFYSGEINGRPYYSCCAYDRVERVRTFSMEQCDAAESLPSIQKTVLQAIKRRRKQLERGLR